jgi:putative FmdB family regulatory protein
MPIYEYRCTSCGHQQEFLRKVSDAPITVCTQCGKPTFTKMLTAAGFQLKGSGWYATDFKNSGARPAAASVPASHAKADEGGAKADEGKKRGAEAPKGGSSGEGATSAPAATPSQPAAAPKADSGGSAASK